MYRHLPLFFFLGKISEFSLHHGFAPKTNTTPEPANLPKRGHVETLGERSVFFIQKWGKYLQFNRLSTLLSHQPNSFISADVLHIYQSRNLPCNSFSRFLFNRVEVPALFIFFFFFSFLILVMMSAQ